MKVWTNNRFTGHYPVGTAAVVVAQTAEDAANLLNYWLAEAGLVQHKTTASDFERLPTTRPTVRVLADGDY